MSISQMCDTGDRNVPYILNKERQVSNHIEDANKPDIEIVLNNSAKNINMMCNSGFYSEVALQTFSGFSVNFTHMIGNVQVKCIEHSPSIDQSGLAANLVSKFIISVGTKLIGSITVHLHNTTRNVQIQGGSTMPDGSTAAVWFLMNCVKPWFQQRAINKRVNIDSVNEAILAIPTASSDSSATSSAACGKCLNPFRGKSKPTLCFYCKKYFHSQSKCKHKCMGS